MRIALIGGGHVGLVSGACLSEFDHEVTCADKDAAKIGALRDGVMILTEWNEFRALDLSKVKAALKTPLVIDLRNFYRPSQMAQAGFRYVGVGRP